MHIPDGFLSTTVSVSGYILSGSTLGAGISTKLKKKLEPEKIPTLGVMAAFIFAAQMVNFPVIGGTSGHLIGGVLAAILLGPWTASVIMTTILAVQCLVFADGGITALGANVFNMGIAAVFMGYFVYSLFCRIREFSYAGVFISAWVSVMVAAVLASFELSLSGTVPLKVILTAMLYWHGVIGIGEGIITVVIVKYLKKVKPDIFNYERI